MLESPLRLFSQFISSFLKVREKKKLDPKGGEMIDLVVRYNNHLDLFSKWNYIFLIDKIIQFTFVFHFYWFILINNSYMIATNRENEKTPEIFFDLLYFYFFKFSVS